MPALGKFWVNTRTMIKLNPPMVFSPLDPDIQVDAYLVNVEHTDTDRVIHNITYRLVVQHTSGLTKERVATKNIYHLLEPSTDRVAGFDLPFIDFDQVTLKQVVTWLSPEIGGEAMALQQLLFNELPAADPLVLSLPSQWAENV